MICGLFERRIVFCGAMIYVVAAAASPPPRIEDSGHRRPSDEVGN